MMMYGHMHNYTVYMVITSWRAGLSIELLNDSTLHRAAGDMAEKSGKIKSTERVLAAMRTAGVSKTRPNRSGMQAGGAIISG